MGLPIVRELPDEETLLTDMEPSSTKLIAADRCDVCPAQALVQAIGDTGSSLLFCGHHFSRHEVALIAQGWLIDDQRGQH